MRMNPGTLFLTIGAMASALAALLHLGCIAFGAPWYRFFGAGERMAQMAIARSAYPVIVTLLIAAVLFTWSLYAFSGAGLIRKLPLLRTILFAITAVYLVRGVVFLPFIERFHDRSPAFWWWSSAICLAIGVVHAAGLAYAWPDLSMNASIASDIESHSRESTP
jgi:hypothetical protein